MKWTAGMRATQERVRAEREAATGAAYLSVQVGRFEPRAVRQATDTLTAVY